MSVLGWVGVVFAVYRLTRLAARDTIFSAREDITNMWVYSLITCYYCIGFWISLAAILVVSATVGMGLLEAAVAAFAVSGASGLLGQVSDYLEAKSIG